MRGIYVGLGANLGDRAGNLFRARRLLAELPGTRLAAVSEVYETEPVGLREQPWFLNQVVELETGLEPGELLSALLDIEARMGRVRGVRWGPRLIDLDLLRYGDLALDTQALTLPHPRMWERAFVLVPLSELAPELAGPGGETAAAAARRLTAGDSLHPWRPRLVGEEVIRLAETDSTNAEAWRRARLGAASGTVVVAGAQTSGRGRQGRKWLSAPGLGLYFSTLFRPGFLPPSAAPAFTMLGAVAARRVAALLGAPAVRLKWPNDLVVPGAGGSPLRKLGGVLAEAASAGEELQAVVLGIGLNLNHRPEDFPPDLAGSATSLAQLTGKETAPERAEAALVQALNDVYLNLLTRDGRTAQDEFDRHLIAPGQETG